MNFNIVKGKRKRSLVFALITTVSIVLLFTCNLVLSIFVPSKAIYFDMTEEGFYTLTPLMKKECDFVKELGGEITVTFCDDPDNIIGAETTRLVYFMSHQLAKRYPGKIKVECVNGRLNPTALAKYKTTSLSEIKPTDVIVSYDGGAESDTENKYIIANASYFWTSQKGTRWSYNGEYRMASIMKSLTAIERPVVYFVTDLGAEYYDPKNPESEDSLKLAYLADLLRERGLDINILSLAELQRKGEEIPEDCSLLIINNPKTDFVPDPDGYDRLDYVSETEILDRYLVKRQGSIMVTKDYGKELPVLESFLSEWGISYGTSLLKDSEFSLSNELGTNTDLIASYNTDKESFGYAIYGDYAAVSSSPRTIFSNTGYVKCSFEESAASPEAGTANIRRQYISLFTSSKAAKPYAKNSITGEYVDLAGEAGVYDLAAVVARAKLDNITSESVYSYVFAAATPDFFSNEILGNPSYANYDIVSSLVNNFSRVDVFADMDLGASSANSASFGGKQIRYSTLSDKSTEIYSADGKEIVEYNYGISKGMITGIAICVFAIPAAILGAGVCVCLRRRYM